MLLAEMANPEIDTSPYRRLLAALAGRTSPYVSHVFITTTWDTLLEQGIDNFLGPSAPAPAWLRNTHVFHLNGAVDAESDRRSPFLLETDPANARTPSLEFDSAINQLWWGRRFVVVGMSFRCPTDRALLLILRSVRRELPVGCSRWLVVNRDKQAAGEVAEKIQAALPESRARLVVAAFEDWIRLGMPELVDAAILV